MGLFYRFGRYCCRWFCVLFFRVRVHGQRNVPREGGVLLVCNHQSFFDPVLVTMALHLEGNYMARDTLFAKPLFKRLIASLNAFPIRRSSADIQAVKETLRRLKQGKVVVTFPEGTRTQDGSVGKFLPGAAAVALKAGATIVPALIEGAYRSWPRQRKLPAPTPVSVRYGRALTPKELQDYTPSELAELLHQRVVGLTAPAGRPNRRRQAQAEGRP